MPAGSTYFPIATTTLGSNQTSITFNSFSGYTDLRLVGAVTSAASQNNYLQFNSDTGTNYSSTYLAGTGSSAVSGRTSTTNQGYVDYVGTTGQHTLIIDIMNYSNSTTYKTWLTKGGDAATNVIAYVGLWRNTAAITSLSLINTTASGLLTGSTFTLYGISAA
jgi:hypothetical protein